jgi:hypothetical protein
MSSWLKEKAVLNWKSSFYVLLEASNSTSVNGTSTAVLQKFANPGGQVLAEYALYQYAVSIRSIIDAQLIGNEF